MRFVSTALLWLLVALTLWFGYLLAVLLLGVTWRLDRHHQLTHRFVCAWCFQYLRRWPFWRVRVVGREKLPKGPCVLVANHQSMSDILALMGLGYGFKFVSKASLFRVPFIGWLMRRLGYVSLERGKLASMQAMIERCDVLLDAGQPVLIFPEGTYASGAHRLPFRRGAFRLAQKHQVPLVPVVLHGTAELIDGDGPWFSWRSRVLVEVKDPLPPPAPEADDADFVREVERRYAEWLGQTFPSQVASPRTPVGG